MALEFSLKRVVGLFLASALTLNASPSLSKAAGSASASAPQSEADSQSAKRRCQKVIQQDSQQLKREKCAPIAQVESKGARLGVVLPLVALTVAAAGATVAASNRKNCGKGNNSQNNGNCPASP